MSFSIVMLTVVIARIVLMVSQLHTSGNRQAVLKKRRFRIAKRLFRKKIRYTNRLFEGHYIDVKSFYVSCFNTVPCITYIGEMDTTQVLQYMKEEYKTLIEGIYQHNYYDHEAGELYFNTTILVLQNEWVIELTGNCCQLFTPRRDFARVKKLAEVLKDFRKVQEMPAHVKILGFARQGEMM
ncbi:MAG: hypothetical protein ACTHJ5_01865 [Ilyomonas sp.]